jgi:hypothetical protein
MLARQWTGCMETSSVLQKRKGRVAIRKVHGAWSLGPFFFTSAGRLRLRDRFRVEHELVSAYPDDILHFYVGVLNHKSGFIMITTLAIYIPIAHVAKIRSSPHRFGT